MQEFSSISVSSYEAGVLADQLTQQSSAGWSVVAIVPTGSTVTAYLSRPSSTGGGDPTPIAAASHHAPDPLSVDEIVADEIAVAEVAVADATQATTEIAPQEVVGGSTAAVGWAASGAGSSSEIAPEIAPSAPEAATEAVAEPAATTPSTATTPEVSTEPASAGAAPAGWYADPSSRFELRYWDGSQWTEHVSRSGQQYTDPPVA